VGLIDVRGDGMAYCEKHLSTGLSVRRKAAPSEAQLAEPTRPRHTLQNLDARDFCALRVCLEANDSDFVLALLKRTRQALNVTLRAATIGFPVVEWDRDTHNHARLETTPDGPVKKTLGPRGCFHGRRQVN
jgi:hypothetical protein